MPTFHARTEIPDVDADELFAWHARPGAFERLAPPWETMKIVRRTGSITDGSELVFRVYQGPIGLTWHAVHEGHEPGRQFRDVQRRGPFARWAHTHRFEPGDRGAILDDRVEYRLPAHPVSDLVAGPLVRKMLERMFTFRHERTMNDLSRHARFEDRPRQVVAITGASGLIGQALTHFLTTGGHTVCPVVRHEPDTDDEIYWKPSAGEIDAQAFEGVDVVINLAGEPINQRWTDEAKRRVLKSRRDGTRLLSETLAGLEDKPRVFVSASAVGYYGARGEEVLTEASDPGAGFLSQVCEAWEDAADPAREAGIRVVHPRIGIVLTPQGGALEQMLTPFKMGVGGRIGSGEQYMSWISLDDTIGALHFAMFTEELEGPFNVVAPNPVDNTTFTKTLGEVLGRPTLLPVPTLALKGMLGTEAAKELLLTGQRAMPDVLQEHGFGFYHPHLEGALRHVLGK